MSDKPLHPFSLPELAFVHLSATISPGTLVVWLLYAVFAFWALYTLVAIYHWLKYSHASWIAFPAIAVHLFVSLALMAYALSGTIIL